MEVSHIIALSFPIAIVIFVILKVIFYKEK
jgi:hypothetical protein